MSENDWADSANPLAVAKPQEIAKGAAVEMVKSRAAMEALAAMAHAKKHPRDEAQAYQRIMTACRRPGLAESATYAYTRGGSKVEGPSIRLAETLVRAWGNCSAGIIELNQDTGESEMMAFAHDLETNTRIEKVFRVPHVRDTKQGKKDLTDARDVYEATASQGARRLRACILAIIPGDVVDDALAECEKTLNAGDDSVEDRAKKMIAAFATLGVSAAQIREKVGHERIDAADIARLRKVYTAIKDGFGSVADHFSPTAPDAPPPPANLDEMRDVLASKATKKKPEQKPISDPTREPTAEELSAIAREATEKKDLF